MQKVIISFIMFILSLTNLNANDNTNKIVVKFSLYCEYVYKATSQRYYVTQERWFIKDNRVINKETGMYFLLKECTSL